MDGPRFDAFARWLSTRVPRRRLLAGLAAVGLGVGSLRPEAAAGECVTGDADGTNVADGTTTLDAGASGGANLTLRRRNPEATNTIVSQGMQPGGRSTITYRDEHDWDIARLAAHVATPPETTEAHWEVYTSTGDDVTFLPRFDIDSQVDWANVTVTNGTLEAAGADPDQSGLRVRRGTTAAEVAEFNRPRTSPNGTNYLRRDLPPGQTAGPVLTVHQDHPRDNQPALRVRQDGAGPWLEVQGAALIQPAVGVAGDAAPLPAAPAGYLRLVVDGMSVVVPFYAER